MPVVSKFKVRTVGAKVIPLVLQRSSRSTSALLAVIAIGLCNSVLAQPVPLPDGAVAWWTGNDNALDIVGGNDGTLLNGATYAPGKVGNAFSFDGNDDFVLVPDNASLNPTSQLTLETWVLITDDSGEVGDIISKDGESFDRQYLLAVGTGSGKFRPHVGVPSGFRNFDGNTSFELNQWYHVAMTYDSAFLKLYVNGVADGSQAVTGPMITTSEAVRIGGGAPAGTAQIHFRGLIDEVGVYNRALSADEIKNIFEADSFGKMLPLPGDLDGNNAVNAADIDLLRDAINTSSTDPQFNVNSDSSLDVGDLSYLVTTIIGTGFGDTDLNFVVNFNDWINLSNNFGKSGTGWAQANFMLDNQTDFFDFVILTNNFGMSFAASKIPEPTGVALLFLGALCALTCRRG